MKLLTVRHSTSYRYARPIEFGRHRLMLRPRDSHDLRLVGAELTLSPPGVVRWMHDVFGNSVALVDFAEPAQELSIVSTLTIERYALPQLQFPLDPEAELYPFLYSSDDRTDLGRLLERHYPDPHGTIDEWAKQFTPMRPSGTLNVLASMNKAIHDSFAYATREQEGTRSPIETIELKAAPAAISRCCSSRPRAAWASARVLCRAISTIPFMTEGNGRCSGRRRDPRLGRGLSARAPAGSNTIRPTAWSPART